MRYININELKKQIISKIDDLNINDKVIIIDETTEIADYYNAMDYFIFPSIFEGLGIVGIEAQVSGLDCFISEFVPEEINISGNIKRININENSKDTADFIGEHVTYRIIVSDESGNTSVSLDYMVKSQYVKPHCAKDFHVKVDRNLGEIELHWSKCGCNVFMTRIYRIDDGVQRLIATLEGQETGYIDSKIAIGHTYQYMILPITSKISQVEMSEIIDY